MTENDLIALLPLIIISSAIIIAMVIIAFYRNHKLTATLTSAGLIFSLVTLPLIYSNAAQRITLLGFESQRLIIIDSYSLFYMGLIFTATLIVTVLSYAYLERHIGLPTGQAGNREEFYILLLLSALGSAIIVSSSHFASFFLGLEILSVSLYSLIAYLRTSESGTEAGVKYLILAAASASFMLFGIALVYAQIGTMEFSGVAEKIAVEQRHNAVLLTGFVMIIIGIGFKLALVPFHMWTPDVYEGAPAPITAFIATVSKGSVFALLLRYFAQVNIRSYESLFMIFTLIAVFSMFFGNFLALFQNNIKRILAYSSIAHMGYLLVAFLSSGSMVVATRNRAVTAVGYYLASYFVTTLGAFGVITVLSGKDRDMDSLDEYRGLFQHRPWLTGVFTAMLLSLAGIPLTAGFIGKFYVAAAGAGSSLWLLLITLAINSAIGLFYYLRVIFALFSTPVAVTRSSPLSIAEGIVMTILTLLLVWFGVYPSHLIGLLQATVGGLG